METNITEGKRERRGFLYKSERERRKDDSAYLYYYAQNGSDDDEDFEADSNELAENDEFDEDFQDEDKKQKKRRKVRRNSRRKEDNDLDDSDRDNDEDYDGNNTRRNKKSTSKSKPNSTKKSISKKTITNSSAKRDKRKRKRKVSGDTSDEDENYDGGENDSEYEPVRKSRKLRKQPKTEEDSKEIQEDITRLREGEEEKAADEGVSTQTLPPKQSVFLVEPQQGNNLCETFQECQLEIIDREIFEKSKLSKEAFN